MVKKVSFVMSIIAACLFTANAATVNGTVSSTAAGTAAISGATVTLTPVGGGAAMTATTSATGAYSFTNVTATAYPANFTIVASASGFVTSGTNLVRIATATATATSNFALDPKALGVIISGTVTVAGSTTPIAGAKVLVRQRVLGGGGGYTPIDSAVTSATGAYSIDSVQAGTYSFLVSATGYNSNTSNNIVVTNAARTEDFQLTALGAGVTISGTVTNATTNALVSGAKVVLSTAGNGGTIVDSATTAANGTYSITAVQPGTYTTTTSAAGYTSITSNNFTVAAAAVTRNIILTPVPGPTTVSGTVTNATTTNPVVGAKVILLNGAVHVDSAVTAANGTYSITGVVAGTYTMNVTAATYTAFTSNNFMINGTPITRNVQLTPLPGPTTVSGIVTDAASNAAISGAKIVLVSNGAHVDSVTTIAAGTYVFASVAAGTYSTIASATGYVTRTSANFTVNGAAVTRNIALTLTPAATTVSGVVTNATTTAMVSGAKVVLIDNSDNARVDSAVTAAAGTYSFTNISASTYTLSVTAANFNNYTSPVFTVAGTPLTRNIALTPRSAGSMAIGLVTAQATGAEVVGAVIYLQQQITGTTWSTIDSGISASNGMYVIDSIQIGNYRLEAVMTGYVTTTQTLAVTNNGTTITKNFDLVVSTTGVTSASIAMKNLAPSIDLVAKGLALRNINESGVVSVFSANGRVVFHTAISAHTTLVALPTSLAKGVYFANVTQKNGVINKMITVK